jgi:hypothetical protein
VAADGEVLQEPIGVDRFGEVPARIARHPEQLRRDASEGRLDEPASSDLAATAQCREHCGGQRIACRVIQRLGGERARGAAVGGLDPGDAGRRLHEAVEAASARGTPRTESGHDHAGMPRAQRTGFQAQSRERIWAVAENHDVGGGEKAVKASAIGVGIEIEQCCACRDRCPDAERRSRVSEGNRRGARRRREEPVSASPPARR